MPGLFDRFKKKKEEEQTQGLIKAASTPEGQSAMMQSVTPTVTPSQSMDPRNGEYDYSQNDTQNSYSGNGGVTGDVNVGASKGSAIWAPYNPTPVFKPESPQNTGEEDVVEPTVNGMARNLPRPESPQNTGEGDVIEPRLKPYAAQDTGEGDVVEDNSFDFSLAEPTEKQRQEEGTPTLSDLEYLEALAPINKEEEDRRMRTASAMNGLMNLSRAMAAFGNYAYAGQGAPAITLPEYRNEDIGRWQDRMSAQRMQYMQGRNAYENHRMQMERAQQQLELDKQKAQTANEYKEAQAERMRIQAKLDRIKLENGGISPELQAKLKAAEEKENRLREQFDLMYGIRERQVAVQEQNANTNRQNAVTNSRRANAYIVNRASGGGASKTVDFVVPGDDKREGTVYSVNKNDWAANRRTLAKAAGVPTENRDVLGGVHSRKDEEIDGDIIANWNPRCDEIVKNIQSVTTSDYQDKKSSGKKASEKKEVIKDDVQKKAEELKEKGVKLEL